MCIRSRFLVFSLGYWLSLRRYPYAQGDASGTDTQANLNNARQAYEQLRVWGPKTFI